MPFTVAIAGTTQHTLMCAQAIKQHPQFVIPFVITPTPKAVGRTRTITQNPLHQFALSNHLPQVLIKNKIDEKAKKEIMSLKRPDFLLVVDFGYLIPAWLLALPKIMPLNIHPSALPRWRGSSPGQFVLLNGDTSSAISLIKLTPKFDQGPIVWQKKFTVDPSWTQSQYYEHSFGLIYPVLTKIILQITTNNITLQPQPLDSPTPIAHKLTKQDSFVEWPIVQSAIKTGTHAQALERTTRAYFPWPPLWTKISTHKGEKRMQLLKCRLDADGHLVLQKVKIEGMKAKPWSEVKNVIVGL